MHIFCCFSFILFFFYLFSLSFHLIVFLGTDIYLFLILMKSIKTFLSFLSLSPLKLSFQVLIAMLLVAHITIQSLSNVIQICPCFVLQFLVLNLGLPSILCYFLYMGKDKNSNNSFTCGCIVILILFVK